MDVACLLSARPAAAAAAAGASAQGLGCARRGSATPEDLSVELKRFGCLQGA